MKKSYELHGYFSNREEERCTGEVLVYSGRLKTAQSVATIPVTDVTTISDVIAAALDQFGLDPSSKLSYRMLKLVLDKGTGNINKEFN